MDAFAYVVGMDIGNRIKTIREAHGLTLKGLAEIAPGMSPSRIGNYETGHRTPGIMEIEILAKALGETISSLVGETKPSANLDVISIPVLDCKACCGTGVNQLEHDSIIDHMRVSAAWARQHLVFSKPDNLAVITAYGHSMAPTFSDGDILLVDRGVNSITLDAIYVLESNNELFIKRVQRKLGDGSFFMLSDNKDFRDQEIRYDEVQVLGRVIWSWNGRKL